MTKEQLRPRLCVMSKGSSGYGFHLHGEKGKTGQFIRLVEPASPAESAGLRAGDRLVQVNGDNVESESHQQVVGKIKAVANETRLLVVDRETDELLKSLGLSCKEEYVHGVPQPEKEEEKVQTAVPEDDNLSRSSSEKESSEVQMELRPRLCRMKKGSNGYGFNLHSEKSKAGQFIRAVDSESPAERAGLLPQDRIVEVNGVSMEGKQHSDVVTAIKGGGDQTNLLVVDPDTDEFFKKCKVSPMEAHLTGALPRLVLNGDMEQKANGNVSTQATSSAPSSNASSPPSTPTSPGRKMSANFEEVKPESKAQDDVGLNLSMSAAAAKEKVHSKRSTKRAPQMDWSKKNELFSNL